MQIRANLRLIPLPPAMPGGRAGSRVADHRGIVRNVPPAFRIPRTGMKRPVDAVILRRRLHPICKRFPRGIRLVGIESLTHHRNLEQIVGTEMHLLAPMRVEQVVAIEAQELRDQSRERRIRFRLDLAARIAEIFRQLMRAQREAGDDAECAAAPAFECPEQIRIAVGVDDENCAVRGNDFSLKQTRRRSAEIPSRTSRSRHPGRGPPRRHPCIRHPEHSGRPARLPHGTCRSIRRRLRR